MRMSSIVPLKFGRGIPLPHERAEMTPDASGTSPTMAASHLAAAASKNWRWAVVGVLMNRSVMV